MSEITYRKAMFAKRGLSDLDAEICAYLQNQWEEQLLSEARTKARTRFYKKGSMDHFRAREKRAETRALQSSEPFKPKMLNWQKIAEGIELYRV